jgi:hypothetical protein
VRIVDTLFVMHHGRFGHFAGGMIVTPDHRQQVSLILGRGSAIDEEGLVRLLRVDRQRAMFGRVGTQAAGVLISILRFLSQGKPDAAVAVDLANFGGLFAPGDRSAEQQQEEAGNLERAAGHGGDSLKKLN